MTRIEGHILTPDGFLNGHIEFTPSTHGGSGHIHALTGRPATEASVRASALPIILPGFVDLHVHGGGGRDVMEGAKAGAGKRCGAAQQVAQTHARFGTTAMLATTMTAPHDDLTVAFLALAEDRAMQARAPAPAAAAKILGVHLEGPYISSGRLGAQPDFARALQWAELEALNAIEPIRLITLAPEIEGGLDVIPALVAAGYKVNLGHSDASYELGRAALSAGAHGFTHLFNAMRGFHHREPGLVGAALAHAHHAEIIADLLHVHPGAIRGALRSIAGLYCVTDSTAAAGMPDGEYQLGRQTVTRCMGGVRLADGTLAGSVLTMDQAFRNLVVELGLSLTEASKRTATIAADFLYVHDRGRLTVGCFADIVVLNGDLQVTHVFTEGRAVDLAN
jgi:N-acetylglucosamine-6-phosphate deacetylase